MSYKMEEEKRRTTGNNRLFPLNLAGSGRSHGNTSICRARVFHSGGLRTFLSFPYELQQVGLI